MAIKVTCRCGAQFAAKKDLAGKTAKCPNCSQTFVVPSQPIAPASGIQDRASGSGLESSSDDDFWSEVNHGTNAAATPQANSPSVGGSLGQPFTGAPATNWITNPKQGKSYNTAKTVPAPGRKNGGSKNLKRSLLIGTAIVGGAMVLTAMVIVFLNLERIKIGLYGKEKYEAKKQYAKIEKGMSKSEANAILSKIPWRNVERQSYGKKQEYSNSSGSFLGSSSSDEIHVIFKLAPDDDTDYAIILRFKDGKLISKRKQEF